ncbi:UNVERIFIED_CONTAM: putative aspartic proteinase GIP2 [Sesamum calycinum]|uniref:Aspartic proteinase GIP2 n=1 Tax=Sesamum calycinum TaxID=2727403 RepID=A0AAW2R9F3_9LAMI
MASYFLSSLLFLVLLIAASNAQTTPTLPIRKDPKTSQFYTTIQMGSNLVAINAVIDLGGPSCGSPVTTMCPILMLRFPVARPNVRSPRGSAASGVICRNAPAALTTPAVPPLIILSWTCSSHKAMPRTHFTWKIVSRCPTFPSLAANRFKLPDKFSLCPPSSGIGKLSVGVSPFSGSLKTTPLIINPVSTYPIYVTGEPSDEYFIDVRSIRVDGKPLSVKSSYFSIDENGVGGTKISTIRNFTALHSSIYKPFTRAFLKAAADMKIKSIAAVPPFRACFSSDSISRTQAGLLRQPLIWFCLEMMCTGGLTEATRWLR